MKKYAYLLLIITLVITVSLFLTEDSLEFSGKAIGGSTTGQVAFSIISQNPEINITSPENKTYNFEIGKEKNISLNVTADRQISNWWFSLEDLKYDEIEKEKVSFVPNTTFEAVRHKNKLTVFANSTEGNVGNESVIYNVSVPNSAPTIKNLSTTQYACENRDYSHDFDVKDLDEDPIQPSINPVGPFFTSPLYVFGGDKVNNFEVFSGELGQDHVGNYTYTVSVTDNHNSTCCADNQDINISVIDLNDDPDIENIESKRLVIGTPNDTLTKTVNVNDRESNLNEISFNASFSNSTLFEINDSGEINYTASNTSNVGNHEVRICAEDSGLDNPHQNISQCNEDGGPKSDCNNFTIFITEPDSRYFLWFYISDFYPKDKEQTVGTESMEFSVQTRSSESNSSNVTWEVNDSEGTEDRGEGKNFSYRFNCKDPGNYTVIAKASDGRAEDQLIWEIEVPENECQTESSSGSSSGGGSSGGASNEVLNNQSKEQCIEKWACKEWSSCKKANQNDKLEKCEKDGISDNSCGYMERNCIDVNNCDTTNNKPETTRSCNYGVKATCSDGVKNCHSGSCEVLLDCGGPCEKCASCSDGIQNQGEEGVDCGSPCTKQCKENEKTNYIENVQSKFIWVLVIVAIVVISLLAYLIRRNKKKRKT
ncbi:MAG: hypothetical protein ABEI74_01525 [Candidatus Pacearchaeota archaeon]